MIPVAGHGARAHWARPRYLAVNACRLAGTKARTVERYLMLLGERLGRPRGDAAWTDIGTEAVLAGGAMLLWSRVLALESGGTGASEEWDWGVERLEAL